jgi:hypothetical protein
MAWNCSGIIGLKLFKTTLDNFLVFINKAFISHLGNFPHKHQYILHELIFSMHVEAFSFRFSMKIVTIGAVSPTIPESNKTQRLFRPKFDLIPVASILSLNWSWEYSNNYLKDLVLNFSVKKASIWENILAAITFTS